MLAIRRTWNTLISEVLWESRQLLEGKSLKVKFMKEYRKERSYLNKRINVYIIYDRIL